MGEEKSSIEDTLKYGGAIGAAIGVWKGHKNSGEGFWNWIKTVSTDAILNAGDWTYDLLRNYVLTSDYEYLQHEGAATLKIINKNYQTECISDNVKNNTFLFASLTHPDEESLEAIIRIKDDISLKILLKRTDAGYILNSAQYGNKLLG